jgi:hypothetical protein
MTAFSAILVSSHYMPAIAHPNQIDYPLHSLAALAGLPPIFLQSCSAAFRSPTAERPRHNISPPHVRHQSRINFRLAIIVKTASR